MIKVNPILEKMKHFADDLDDCLIVKVYLREVEHD